MVTINYKLPYDSDFQNCFLRDFGKNTNIIEYRQVKGEEYMLLEVYCLPAKWQGILSVYLPFKYMNYNLRYLHESE